MSGSTEPGKKEVRSTMVYVCPNADYSIPIKIAIKDKHLELVRLVGG